MADKETGPNLQLDELEASLTAHLKRAKSLGVAVSALALLRSKLDNYTQTDSNILDTGSVTISIFELMSIAGVYDSVGAAKQLRLGQRAVAEIRDTEIQRSGDVMKSAATLRADLNDNSAAGAFNAGVEDNGLAGS